MNILAIDTAGDCCALALRTNGQTCATHVVATQRDQAKILAPLTQQILQNNKLTTQQIDRFAISTGPGSFTGLRVGLSFVHGLALANNKPAIGIDNFCMTAHAIQTHYPTKKPVLIVRESKRADLFCTWLNTDNTLGPYFLCPAAQIIQDLAHKEDVAIAGDGAAQLILMNGALESTFVNISHEMMIQSLAQLAENAESTINVLPQPLYLRDADVTAPKSLAHSA